MLYSVLNSKQKQLHGHKSNKMRESTLSWIGNFEEKMDLSHIYLAVLNIFIKETFWHTSFRQDLLRRTFY